MTDEPQAAPKPKKRRRRKKAAAEVSRRPAAPAAPAEAPRRRSAGPGRLVLLSATASVAGLAMVSIDASDTGRALWIGGVIGLAAGIHWLGRSGPDVGPPADESAGA